MKKSEIKAFKCDSCQKLVSLGECGEHRIETNHEEFTPIYSTKIVYFKEMKGLYE